MPDPAVHLVARWIDAYYAGRDDDLLAIAHPGIEVHPRVGIGPRRVKGRLELHNWLRDTRGRRSDITAYDLTSLGHDRVLAEARLEGMGVVAIFQVRDDRVARVDMYVSDRELLAQLGAIHERAGHPELHVEMARQDPTPGGTPRPGGRFTRRRPEGPPAEADESVKDAR